MSGSKSEIVAPLITTYLQMQSHLEIRKPKSEIRKADLEVRELTQPDWRFNREMYFKVGEQWKWIDKRPWTDEQWKEYASDPNLRTFGGYCGGEVAGYFELKRTVNKEPTTENGEAIEIAYFGLLPEFIGRGLGSALLTSAIQ